MYNYDNMEGIMENKIYYTVSSIDDEKLYKSTNLPKTILDHVKKYHGIDDAKKSIIAYNILKNMLHKFSHNSIEDVYFHESGKPCVEDGYISISHSNKLIVVSYGHSKIGIDIEKIGHASRGIYSKIFTKEELPNVTNIDFYKRWTLLESKVKMNDSNIFDFENLDKYNAFSSIEKYDEEEYVLTIITDDKDAKFERI